MDIELLRTSPIIRKILDENNEKVRAEGRFEGRIEGKIEVLLQILALGSAHLSGTERPRFNRCFDPAQFEAWLDAAIGAYCPTDVFAARAPAGT